MGLENSGMKSITQCLQNQFCNIITSIHSTPSGKDFGKFLGNRIQQLKYETCMDNAQKLTTIAKNTLQKTDFLVFVIDIHHSKKFQESLNYLYQIIQFLFAIDKDFQLVLLFHKTDLLTNRNLKENEQQLLYNVVKSTGSHPIPIYHYRTSIFNPLSILTSFSHPVFVKEGIISPLNSIMEEFSKLNHLDYICLLTNNFCQIGSYYAKNDKFHRFHNENKIFLQKNAENFTYFSELQHSINDHIIFFKKFYIKHFFSDFAVYLAWSENIAPINRNIQNHIFELQEDLKNILSDETALAAHMA
jgi:hypothetical protein